MCVTIIAFFTASGLQVVMGLDFRAFYVDVIPYSLAFCHFKYRELLCSTVKCGSSRYKEYEIIGDVRLRKFGHLSYITFHLLS